MAHDVAVPPATRTSNRERSGRNVDRQSRHAFAYRLLLVSAPAFFLPMTIWGSFYDYMTRENRILLIGLATTLVGLGLAWILDRIGLDRRTSSRLAMIAVIALVGGGSVSFSSLGARRTVLLAAMIVLGSLLVVRLRDLPLLGHLFTWLGLALWLWGIGAVGGALIADQPSLLDGVDRTPPAVPLADGDVVVVLFDEYPGFEFAEDELGVDQTAVRTALVGDGYSVVGDLRVNYSGTELALPSFFLQTQPSSAGDATNEATRADLLEVIGGENPMVRAFDDKGYDITVVESGWSGLRCQGIVDHCVVRSFHDEVTQFIADRSAAGWAVQAWLGDAFIHGAVRNLRWLRDELPALIANDHNDFVFVHLMIPHTPAVLDANCERTSATQEGSGREALADQVRCANGIVEQLADITASASITVMFGDHGTKTQHQLGIPADQWSHAMIRERMLTFAAVRGPDRCHREAPDSVTNVGVWLMRCAGAEVPYVDSISLGTSLDGEPWVPMDPFAGT